MNLIDKRNTAIQSKIVRSTRSSSNRAKQARKELKNAIFRSKSEWITNLCDDLNMSAARQKGTRTFWDCIKSIKNGLDKPPPSSPVMMRKEDGSKCQSPEENAEIFKNHFEKLYNKPANFDPNILNHLDECPIDDSLGVTPSTEEVHSAIKHLKNNSPGESGITAQMLKSIALDVVCFDYLYRIITDIWSSEKCPSQWDIGRLVILPKKGDLSKPGNYRGIMLLEIAYKIVAIVINKRLQPLIERLDHENQCGFRKGRGCTDAVFTVKMAIKKRREHNLETWILFLDLVKAFDRVPRELLWSILSKFGVSNKMINVLKLLHATFKVTFEVDSVSHTMPTSIGVKQGDILGPALFIIFIAAVMITWRKIHKRPLCIFRTKNDSQLTGRRYNSKGTDFDVDDSEYADDTAVMFNSREDTEFYSPLLVDHFDSFGMEIHAGDYDVPDKPSKTEILFVSKPLKSYTDRETFDNTRLTNIELGNHKFFPIVDKFCYLGTFLTRDCKDDLDVTHRIRKASNAFGSLRKSLFSNKSITYQAKGSAYRSLILPILLHGAETWSLTEKLFNLLRNFHHMCVRAMCRVNRTQVYIHRITTVSLLQRLSLEKIDHYVTKRQLSWLGHVARMPFDRLPRKLLSSWVYHRRPKGSPEFTYGRGIYKALRKVNVGVNEWYDMALNRNVWNGVLNNVT